MIQHKMCGRPRSEREEHAWDKGRVCLKADVSEDLLGAMETSGERYSIGIRQGK